MPPLPNYPGVLKIVTQFSRSADTNIGTALHFLYSGTPPSDATCNTMATSISGFAIAQLVPLLDGDSGLHGIEVTDLSSPTAGHGLNATTSGGSRSGGVMPAATCALQSMKIARRYRGGKPRAYWPFGTATDLSNNQNWSGTALTDFAANLTAYIGGIIGLTTSGCVIGEQVSISYYSGFTAVVNPVTGRTRDVPKVRTAAITPDPIVSWAILTQVASQRRRNLTP
jgi:hypothetical protein